MFAQRLSVKPIAAIATILSLPFLALYWALAGRLITGATGETLGQSPVLALLFFAPLFWASLIFSTLWGYISATALGLIAAVGGLIWRPASRPLRIWTLVLILAIAAFPFVFQYQPALTAAPGHSMQWVTDPGFLGRVVKAAQNMLEKTPCQYDLQGWAPDGWLYYRATCDGKAQMWRYSPAQPGSPAPVSQLPEGLTGLTAPESHLLATVRANIWPKGQEPAMRSILMKEVAVSPDARWAAVGTRHIYGLEDVIVLDLQPAR